MSQTRWDVRVIKTVWGILAAVVFGACGTSTQIVDASWDDAAVIEELNRIGTSRRVSVNVWTESSETADAPVAMGGQFRIEADSLLWKSPGQPTVALGRIAAVRFADGRDHRQGAQNGLLVGGVAGGTFGLVMGLASMADCGAGRWLFCDLSFGDALKITAYGAFVWGVTGSLFGAAVGARRRTVYRFYRDTPHEVKVVVGVPMPGGHRR